MEIITQGLNKYLQTNSEGEPEDLKSESGAKLRRQIKTHHTSLVLGALWRQTDRFVFANSSITTSRQFLRSCHALVPNCAESPQINASMVIL